MKHISKGLFTLLLLISTQIMAAGPRPSVDMATCTRSATLLACSDAQGNGYSVATAGSTTYLRGYEVIGKKHWAQTNSRFDQLTFFTGLASNGDAWIGTIQRIGWTTITRVSSSDGTRSKITCSRLNGCH
ncbi:glutamine synthetase [Pseudomonas cichorii]|nr:glutamine synthetase [Pseudomonas cichorii]